MDTEKILYSINVEDIINVSKEIKIEFTVNDIDLLEKKIGNFMGDSWYEAIEFALKELKSERRK